MRAKEFVERLCTEVIERNATHYARMLATPSDAVRDESARMIVTAFERMDKLQKEAVQMLVRRVLVDTLANVFGILDGSTLMNGYREDFLLTYGKSREVLSGDLQDLLLSTIGKV